MTLCSMAWSAMQKLRIKTVNTIKTKKTINEMFSARLGYKTIKQAFRLFWIKQVSGAAQLKLLSSNLAQKKKHLLNIKAFMSGRTKIRNKWTASNSALCKISEHNKQMKRDLYRTHRWTDDFRNRKKKKDESDHLTLAKNNFQQC